LCDAVIQAIIHHGPRVSAVLTEKFGPRLGEEETVPDFQQFQQFFLGILQAARGRVVASEAEHVDELAGDGEKRTLRDEAYDGLKSVILEQRDFFAGTFGPGQAERMGFPSRIGRWHMELLRQGDHLVKHLTDPAAELPPPRFAGVSVDLAQAAAPILPAVERLRSTMDEAGRELKMAELTQVDRNRAMEELDTTLLWSARSLEAIYRLAGETELADRIRPAARRPGRPEAGEGEPAAADESGGGPSQPAPAPAPEAPVTDA
jgi:hypothetical protein